jgi:hypothetical protein
MQGRRAVEIVFHFWQTAYTHKFQLSLNTKGVPGHTKAMQNKIKKMENLSFKSFKIKHIIFRNIR